MKAGTIGALCAAAAVTCTTIAAAQDTSTVQAVDREIGRVQIATVPVPANRILRTATFTPSGKILVTYSDKDDTDRQLVRLAIMDEDGRNFRPIFAQVLPKVEKDNGLRYMVFADNKRVFLGDFVVECVSSLDACTKSSLLPVEYPAEVAAGDHISHRWSEMIIAPDNLHVAWTTLLSNYSAIVFVGEMRRQGQGYRIVNPRIISTLDPFRKDPAHADGTLAIPVNGGEVKQFVAGGTGISLVGAVKRDLPDSVVQHLDTDLTEGITDTPGYTETTIFSPDERLGITMTARFSKADPAILGLVPRPYPTSLNMSLPMLAYTYAVDGVRGERSGNIGPALIDIAKSKTREGYLGTNLSADEQWVFRSPMSWHPGGGKAMWIEGHRGDGAVRIRVATLPDYKAGPKARMRPFPRKIPGSSSDMSLVKPYAEKSQNIDVKVYGRNSGFITYRRTPEGVIEKTYSNFSDTPQAVYSGNERIEVNLGGRSTYTANVKLSGAKPGVMDLKMTFGPLRARLPAQLIFDRDASGMPLTHGYAEYEGRRLDAQNLAP
ncbi:hypothetical protein KRR38_03330 [Novosphingobium sp. G106]|uniref:hypothetical protein n=1 Tax=Novosphingobium sp. G106 TaxID=2849500 RepID=UPI001C2D31B7|nr:hypothetical protein [Novosphingobium sp. G106]MBV1686728.1 hypothetical protein [Novosphingobium sp. G106]